MADGGEQRGAHPVALGERLCLSGLRPQPVPIQRCGRLGGEPVEQLAVDRHRLAGHDERQVTPRP